MENISVIILAAGKSNRMGENKLSLLYNEKPLIQYTFDLVKKVKFFEFILVISPDNAKELGISKDKYASVKVIYNSNIELGLSHSVYLGTKEAKGDGYLFLAGDQPLLTEDLINEIIHYAGQEKIVFPVDGNGNPSNPTFFGGGFRKELLDLKGDKGGREIRDKYGELCVTIKTDYPEQLMDIDTPEKYKELLQRNETHRKEAQRYGKSCLEE